MGYRTKAWLAVASLATIAVLAVAGCGGNDDDEGPSKQEFIAQADAICQEADKEQAAVGGKGAKGGITARTSAMWRSCRGTTP